MPSLECTNPFWAQHVPKSMPTCLKKLILKYWHSILFCRFLWMVQSPRIAPLHLFWERSLGVVWVPLCKLRCHFVSVRSREQRAKSIWLLVFFEISTKIKKWLQQIYGFLAIFETKKAESREQRSNGKEQSIMCMLINSFEHAFSMPLDGNSTDDAPPPEAYRFEPVAISLSLSLLWVFAKRNGPRSFWPYILGCNCVSFGFASFVLRCQHCKDLLDLTDVRPLLLPEVHESFRSIPWLRARSSSVKT